MTQEVRVSSAPLSFPFSICQSLRWAWWLRVGAIGALLSSLPADGLAESGETGVERMPVGKKVMRRVYVTQRLNDTAPAIDGDLSDAAWTVGDWASDFTQREPKQGEAPAFRTDIKVLYDDRNLYVAVRAFDSKIATRPRIMAGRDEFGGDMVGISIDSFHNKKTSFEFNVTSGGSKVDLILDNLGHADTSWNAVWECKVGYEKDAWVAEYRIPLNQLRYTARGELVWGMHFWRWVNELQEESNWSLIPMDHPGFIYSFGELHGLKDLPPHRHLEIAPYSVLSYKTRAPQPDNPLVKDRSQSLAVGADLKYGLSSNLTLDVTLNPDFGQVEADPSEINLSTVEIFQRERRPYFLEGKAIFDYTFGDDLVYYSRRIGASPRITLDGFAYVESPEASRILGSAKITGRTESGLSLGLMAASTEKSYANTYDDGKLGRKLVDPQTQYLTARLQQDLAGGDLVVGGMFTAVQRSDDGDTMKLLPKTAMVAGGEVIRYWKDRSYFATVRLAASRLSGTEEAIRLREDEPVHNFARVDGSYAGKLRNDTLLQGHAGLLQAGKGNGGKWRYNGFVSWRSPGVDFNDAGYMARADSREMGAQLQYFDSTNGRVLKRQDHRLVAKEMRNFGGLLLNRNVNFRSEMATRSNYFLLTNFGATWDRLDTRDLRGGPAIAKPMSFPMWFYAEGDGGKKWQPRLEGSASTTTDQTERWVEAEPSISFRPNSRLSAQIGVMWERNFNDHQYVDSPTIAGNKAWIVGKMSQNTVGGTLRLAYQFSPDLSISYFGGPFASSGRFSDYQRVVNARSRDRSERFRAVSTEVGPDGLLGDDQGNKFTFSRPDFDWRELKSNLVVRWEYRPGSSIYCVWSQHRGDTADLGEFSATEQFRKILSSHPENTFLIKASYWFSI